MKFKFTLVAFISFLFVQAACKKDKIIYSHNQSLRDKSLDYIKATIAGNWEIKKIYSCGFIGCNCSNVQNDYVFFLANDTVKRVTNGNVVLYEKAIITKQHSYYHNDEVYMYSLAGGFYLWTMSEI